MNLPQPERIFGPDEADRAEASALGGEQKKGKRGVGAEDWEKVKLDDEVPESVRTGKMTHSRNASRV